MSKLNLSTITSGYGAVDALNANFDAIETAVENTLSRDGTSPNSMGANLDMDSNRILNLPQATTSTEPVRKAEFDAAVLSAESGASLLALGFNSSSNGIRLGINANEPTTQVLTILQDTSEVNDQGISSTVSIQRTVGYDEGLTNPKALRVKTIKSNSNAQTEWAISGELDNYSNTVSSGEVAVSGTANKYGTASVFAGHFNALDNHTYTNATAVTGVVGAELHAAGMGPDHPTSNSLLGVRITADLVARTPSQATPTWSEWAAATAYTKYDIRVPVGTALTAGYTGFYYVATTAGTSGGAEPVWPTTIGSTVADGTVTWTAYRGGENGCGIRIRNGTLAGDAKCGYYRVGVAIQDDLTATNLNHMDKALEIRTGGRYGIHMPTGASLTHSIADILLEQDSASGIILNGSYTNAALRINAGQAIAWEATNSVKTSYNNGVTALEFSAGGIVKASINVGGSPAIKCATFTNDNATLSITTTTAGNILISPAGDIKIGKALVAMGGGAAPTLGTIGGSGPATAGQNSWMRFLDSTGATCWLPVWK